MKEENSNDTNVNEINHEQDMQNIENRTEDKKFKFDSKSYISLSMFLVPILLGIIYYDQLPNRMAVHFDNNNKADGFAPKLFALFGIVIILLIVHICVIFSLEYDIKKKSQPKILKVISYWICPVLTVVVQIQIIAYGLGKKFDITTYIVIGIGILLIILGNYLPKTRHNYTMGIKLPWTLSSESNWNKTHRLAGKLWILGGLIIVIQTIVGKYGMISTAVLITIVVIPTLYSFITFIKERSQS